MTDHDRNALEQDLRDFEPVFWVGPWGEALERLYEPDGTLYAICLDGPVVVATDRRRVTVNRGDLVILPPMVAVELSEAVRWFGLVYTGPYPYHFRERFIQVWGFEHVASGFGAASPNAPAEPGPRDLRHRIYASFPPFGNREKSTGPEFEMAVTLESDRPEGFSITWASPSGGNAKSVESIAPGSIVFEIPSEAFYLTHRMASPPATDAPAMSPEYRPQS